MVRATSYAGVLALCLEVMGKEINMNNVVSSLEYSSGAVHSRSMKAKMGGLLHARPIVPLTKSAGTWDPEIASRRMNSAQYPELGNAKCENGFAAAIPGDPNNTLRCNNIDLYHFVSHADLGSKVDGQASSSWGWTSDDGREFFVAGQFDGTTFVEITSEGKMLYLGCLPQSNAVSSIWREIRVLKLHVVIGSEAIKDGVVVFDLRKLLDLHPSNPKTFSQGDLTGYWDNLPVGRTHNIAINEELNYVMAVDSVGGNETHRIRENLPCSGGLIFLNMTDPSNS